MRPRRGGRGKYGNGRSARRDSRQKLEAKNAAGENLSNASPGALPERALRSHNERNLFIAGARWSRFIVKDGFPTVKYFR